jgi:hypothetical protein
MTKTITSNIVTTGGIYQVAKGANEKGEPTGAIYGEIKKKELPQVVQ